LGLLENLAEMAMVLVRGAFAQAVEEQKEREEAARDPAPPAAEPAAPKPAPARPKPVRDEPAEPRPARVRGPWAPCDPRVIFLRLSREVRQILALHARIAAAAERAGAARGPVPPQNPADIARKNLILRVLDEAMTFFGDALADDPSFDPDAVRTHFGVRIEEDDNVDDVPWVPVGVMVDRLAREINLAPDWRLWEDEDWAKEEIRTRPPGSPYRLFPFTLEQEEAFDRAYVEQVGGYRKGEPPNPRGYFARRRPP
jgi:hypothetical protein